MADPKEEKDSTGGDDGENPSTTDQGNSTGARPKTYILHRTNGKGRSHPIPEGKESDEDRKPPCGACYVPPPVYYLAGVLEQNRFCEAFGRIGCFGRYDSKLRKKILMFGLAANIVSLILSIVACFSLSLNFNHIKAGGFTKGIAYIPGIDLPTSAVWIGLRGVAIRTFQGQSFLGRAEYAEGDYVIPFDTFCDYKDAGLANWMEVEDCDNCNEASSTLITTVIMATFLTLPNIFTDILRMFPNYDLNCQKFFGSVLNLASAISALSAYFVYSRTCFASFYDDSEGAMVEYSNVYKNVLINSIWDQIPLGGATPAVDYLWAPGNGIICIVVATILKAIDIIAMLLIPTPDIAHNKKLQEEYEELYGNEEAESDSSPPQNTEEEDGKAEVEP